MILPAVFRFLGKSVLVPLTADKLHTLASKKLKNWKWVLVGSVFNHLSSSSTSSSSLACVDLGIGGDRDEALGRRKRVEDVDSSSDEGVYAETSDDDGNEVSEI